MTKNNPEGVSWVVCITMPSLRGYPKIIYFSALSIVVHGNGKRWHGFLSSFFKLYFPSSHIYLSSGTVIGVNSNPFTYGCTS